MMNIICLMFQDGRLESLIEWGFNLEVRADLWEHIKIQMLVFYSKNML